MFDQLQKLPDDPILKLSQLFRDDTRTPKLDVGVGIFQNEQGETPVMRAVKESEKRLLAEETSKKYVGLLGNLTFNREMEALVLGKDFPKNRVRSIQATAGTGALRLIGELLKSLLPNNNLRVSDPTWGNHQAIFQACGFTAQNYPYYDRQNSVVAREALFSALESFGKNDIVLLHGCCHNPSGADLSPADWDKVVEIAQRRGWLPVVDLAYLGFGENLEADAYGVRKLASSLETVLIAVSCSKNFGLYRERVGQVIAVGKNEAVAEALQSHLGVISRASISMPPNHGAEIVAKILSTPELRADWENELTAVCAYIHDKRLKLQNALTAEIAGDWRFITEVHRGMFTLLPLGKERVERLRNEFAIYIVGEGRINLAGLKSDFDVDYLVQSIKKTL